MHTNPPANTNLPDVSLSKAERRENAADLHITLADASANAAEAVDRQQQLAALEAPAYPLEAEPEPLTIWQLIFGWPARFMERSAKQGRVEYARKLRALIASAKAHRGSLPQQVLAKKHAAQLAYTVTLEEIDCWQKVEYATTRADIKRMEAELELLEAEQ